MALAFPAPAPVMLAIVGSDDLFPVRRIYCVGRNYADHAREMGADPDREPPFFFAKPADAIVADGSIIPYPAKTADLHHEIELVVALGTGGRDIAVADAPGHIFGYAAGLDLTRRDLQAAAKQAGKPWDMAKGFDHSAPCSAIVPAAEVDAGHGAIRLAVNGEQRQSGDIGDLIWSLAEVIAYLSAYVELRPGDLIYTGTPAGVGPLVPGDVVTGEIEGIATIRLTIAG